MHARAIGRSALALLGQILLFYGGFALCALYCINPTCSDPAENLGIHTFGRLPTPS